MRRALFVAVVLASLQAACAVPDVGEWQRGPAPTCVTSSRGRLLVMAQSVPEAEFIPCLGELPTGWELADAATDDSGSRVVLENDAFAQDLAVVLAASCDVSSARRTDSPRPGTESYVSRNGRIHTFTFAGGCITFEYDTRTLADSVAGRAAADSVAFMSRDTLRTLSDWSL